MDGTELDPTMDGYGHFTNLDFRVEETERWSDSKVDGWSGRVRELDVVQHGGCIQRVDGCDMGESGMA